MNRLILICRCFISSAVVATFFVAGYSQGAGAAQDSQSSQQTQNSQQQNQTGSDCARLPARGALQQALNATVTPGQTQTNGGLGNHMWAVMVDRSGAVCAVVNSGESFGDQWPGSRAIAAKKAYTANAFSLGNFALSSANLYFPTQPGGSLFALETSNPVTDAIYAGSAENWGTQNDPLVGQRAGGITLFGGGLALYAEDGSLVGALGLSGDKSCTDHIIAWKVRHELNFDTVPKGVHPDGNDNIIFDLVVDPATGRLTSTSGYGHPSCGGRAEEIARGFSETHPTGPEP